MSANRRRRALFVTAVAVASIAGCAADDAATSAPTRSVPAAGETVEVDAGDLTFRPDQLRVTAGVSVAITLRSTDIEHDLTIDDADFSLHVGANETGSDELRIDEPGTYSAYCSVPGHRAAGMEMTVTVTA